MLQNIFSFFYGIVTYVFGSLTSLVTATHFSTQTHTVFLHTNPIIKYRGPQTYVPISILVHHLGDDQKSKASFSHSDADKMQIQLVRRGWRAGLFGWNIAAYLGAKTGKGATVTPEVVKSWDAAHDGTMDTFDKVERKEGRGQGEQDSVASASSSSLPLALETPTISSKRQTSYEKQLKSLTISHGVPPSKLLSTHLIRIPVSAGDGYFRFAITMRPTSSPTICFSPTFRLFSISLSSACPRGASIVPPTILPELLLRTISTALFGSLLALFPVASLLEKVLPRSWTRWIMRKLYGAWGGDERRKQMLGDWKVQERIEKVQRGMDKGVPWSSAGIRTMWEVERDEKRGRGGVTFVRGRQ